MHYAHPGGASDAYTWLAALAFICRPAAAACAHGRGGGAAAAVAQLVRACAAAGALAAVLLLGGDDVRKRGVVGLADGAADSALALDLLGWHCQLAAPLAPLVPVLVRKHSNTRNGRAGSAGVHTRRAPSDALERRTQSDAQLYSHSTDVQVRDAGETGSAQARGDDARAATWWQRCARTCTEVSASAAEVGIGTAAVWAAREWVRPASAGTHASMAACAVCASALASVSPMPLFIVAFALRTGSLCGALGPHVDAVAEVGLTLCAAGALGALRAPRLERIRAVHGLAAGVVLSACVQCLPANLEAQGKSDVDDTDAYLRTLSPRLLVAVVGLVSASLRLWLGKERASKHSHRSAGLARAGKVASPVASSPSLSPCLPHGHGDPRAFVSPLPSPMASPMASPPSSPRSSRRGGRRGGTLRAGITVGNTESARYAGSSDRQGGQRMRLGAEEDPAPASPRLPPSQIIAPPMPRGSPLLAGASAAALVVAIATALDAHAVLANADPGTGIEWETAAGAVTTALPTRVGPALALAGAAAMATGALATKDLVSGARSGRAHAIAAMAAAALCPLSPLFAAASAGVERDMHDGIEGRAAAVCACLCALVLCVYATAYLRRAAQLIGGASGGGASGLTAAGAAAAVAVSATAALYALGGVWSAFGGQWAGPLAFGLLSVTAVCGGRVGGGGGGGGSGVGTSMSARRNLKRAANTSRAVLFAAFACAFATVARTRVSELGELRKLRPLLTGVGSAQSWGGLRQSEHVTEPAKSRRAYDASHAESVAALTTEGECDGHAAEAAERDVTPVPMVEHEVSVASMGHEEGARRSEYIARA